jgi:hypothetical protein
MHHNMCGRKEHPPFLYSSLADSGEVITGNGSTKLQ